MAITQITNNVILDGTILPAKLNVSANMRTFLGNETISAINGSTVANGSITIQGTTNSTRTTSYVLLQPSGGNVGIGLTTPTVTLDVAGISRVNSLYLTNGGTSSSNGITNNGNESAGLWFNNFSTIIAGYNGIMFRSSLAGTAGQTERMRITNSGQIGVGTASPNSSAILDLSSTSLGFLPPRMTSTQRNAISSPASGLVVYSSDLFDLSLYNGTAWGDVLTTHSASFTSDTLRTAVSDETGTGSLVFATSPTLTSPTVATSLVLNATSYTYGTGAREALLNSMSERFVYKDGLVPYAEIFDDFPHYGNNGGAFTIGTHGWQFTRTAGTGVANAYYNPGSSSSSYRAYGVISCTTANTIGAVNFYQLGPYNGQAASPYGLSIQTCFCVDSITQCRYILYYGGGGTDLRLRINFSDGTIDILRSGESPIILTSDLTFATGNFSSGTRYRLFFRPISTTQTEVYFASSPWNSSTWTTLVNQIYTHAAYSDLGWNNTTPYFGIQTTEAASKTAYIDWVAIRQEIQR